MMVREAFLGTSLSRLVGQQLRVAVMWASSRPVRQKVLRVASAAGYRYETSPSITCLTCHPSGLVRQVTLFNTVTAQSSPRNGNNNNNPGYLVCSSTVRLRARSFSMSMSLYLSCNRESLIGRSAQVAAGTWRRQPQVTAHVFLFCREGSSGRLIREPGADKRSRSFTGTCELEPFGPSSAACPCPDHRAKVSSTFNRC